MDALIDRFLNQLDVVLRAPLPFVIGVVIVGWLVWVIARGRHETRISNLESRLRLRDDEISDLRRRVDQSQIGQEEAGAAAVVPSLARTVSATLSPAENPLSDERMFVGENITPRFLMGLYQDKTSIQGESASRPYVGKWIRIRERLNDVSCRDEFNTVSLRQEMTLDNLGDWYNTALILCYFSHRLERLEILQPGDEVTIQGKIKSIQQFSLVLVECEFIQGELEAGNPTSA